jgi:S-adenosyl-L-methionine hydrolase (adenosine-forming)
MSEKAGIITLLSDFGTQDVYIGVLKGVIAQINPLITVIDLTHEIPPQDLALGSFQLSTAYGHFPAGTVHLAVVDPGVGSARRPIALQIDSGFLVGPDNGLFSGVLADAPAIAAVELTDPWYWYTAEPSHTFHGRDIFAPVAAHLASGAALEDLGRQIVPEDLVLLPHWSYQQTSQGITGSVQAVDRFGNLVTSIPGKLLQSKTWMVEIAGQMIPGVRTYSDLPDGALLGLVGSHGWIEIAVNKGNAHHRLDRKVGDAVQVVVQKL